MRPSHGPVLPGPNGPETRWPRRSSLPRLLLSPPGVNLSLGPPFPCLGRPYGAIESIGETPGRSIGSVACVGWARGALESVGMGSIESETARTPPHHHRSVLRQRACMQAATACSMTAVNAAQAAYRSTNSVRRQTHRPNPPTQTQAARRALWRKGAAPAVLVGSEKGGSIGRARACRVESGADSGVPGRPGEGPR